MNGTKANILVYIDYKGKRLKKYFGLGMNRKIIYILITDKQNKNNYIYHFVCVLESGNVLVPSTNLIPKETSYIFLNFKEHKFNIPIHSIYSLGQNIPTSLNFSIDFNV